MDHATIYDPVRDRMLFFGGKTNHSPWEWHNDVWELSFGSSAQWTELTPSGTPPSEGGGFAVYDPIRDRMILKTGSEVWELSLAGNPSWTLLVTSGTPPSDTGAQIYDPVRDRIVATGQSTDEMWELSLGSNLEWELLSPIGTPPNPRIGHTAIYDPIRDRMVVFAGRVNNGGWAYDNGVWALSFEGDLEWTELLPSGELPDVRGAHTAIYDPINDRMVIFGGWGNNLNLDDTWALSLGENPKWLPLLNAGEKPLERYSHSAIYNPLDDTMIIFGGRNFPGISNNRCSSSSTLRQSHL
jgi:hypothetical protein